MRHSTLTVYDDYIYGVANDSVTVSSSDKVMSTLAEYDPLAIQVVLEVATADATCTVEAHIEQSGDGIYFQPKNVTSEIPAAAGLVSGQVYTRAGSESYNCHASHAFVRIVTTLASTTATIPAGSLKVYATGLRRLSRAAVPKAGAKTPLHSAIARRLSKGAVSEVNAFRARHGMSTEALDELQRLWEGAPHADDAERGDHVEYFMSLRTRRELAAFSEAVRKHARPGMFAELHQATKDAAVSIWRQADAERRK